MVLHEQNALFREILYLVPLIGRLFIYLYLVLF